MSLKLFLFLAPVAVGGYVVATREPAPASAAETASAEKAAAPARKSEAECRALEQRLLEASAAAPVDNGFAAMQRVNAMYRELRSQGCNPGAGQPNFEAPHAAMGPAPAGSGAPRADGTSFEPGRPMVDVRRGNAR